MEYIKTQLQLQQALPNGQAPKYTGMVSGFRYTIRTHGFATLYTGLTPSLIGAVPKAGIRFGSNAFFKDALRREDGSLTPGRQFLAGLGAGVAESIAIVTPLETIKVKLIATNQPMVEGIKSIVAQDGVAGLYKGLFATILKQGSNHGLRFMAFNSYKDWLTDDGARTIRPVEALVGGMGAGLFSVMGNNPFDVVKTRMQSVDASKYKSTFDCFAQTWKKEGPAAFYKGAIPRCGRVVPGQGVIFMSFETIQEWVKVQMGR